MRSVYRPLEGQSPSAHQAAKPYAGVVTPEPTVDKPGKRHPPIRCLHRIGFGNDVHRLEAGRKLILGGVRIPFEMGSAGHSDGDALAHAVCDALLGAAALGDIGTHFPDTSPRWHNASSLAFLRHARVLLQKSGYRIVNLDATVGLERPHLRPHIPLMRKRLAQALGISVDQVSVKAKTGEGKDAVGRGEAIRAEAIALVERTKAEA